MTKTDIWMPLYVADYLSSTTRLTTEQHGAYLLLIIDYWKSGRLPDDDSVLANVTRLSVDAWAKHRGVLQGFFEVNNGEWIHSRIEKELEKSGDLKKAQIKKSILGNYVKYGKIDSRVETDSDLKEWWAIQSLKHSHRDTLKAPPSPSPSPSPTHLSKDKNKKATVVACPPDVAEQVWSDWLLLRKGKKASVTETVIEGARAEAAKLNWPLERFLIEWCTRGSQGLKAEWVANKQNQTETVYQRSMRLKMQEAVPSIAKQAPEPYQDASEFFRTIDMETQKAIEVNK
jgi:uncharacterized protein YdaU (DUF1376 family)